MLYVICVRLRSGAPFCLSKLHPVQVMGSECVSTYCLWKGVYLLISSLILLLQSPLVSFIPSLIFDVQRQKATPGDGLNRTYPHPHAAVSGLFSLFEMFVFTTVSVLFWLSLEYLTLQYFLLFIHFTISHSYKDDTPSRDIVKCLFSGTLTQWWLRAYL